jgi:hypothetical protein
VNLKNAHKGAKERECRHACEDFRKLFNENAQSLYLLSFLLSASHEKAEKCFVEGLDDCVERDCAFQHWGHSWSRRLIVRNALRIVAPKPLSRGPARGASQSPDDLRFQRPWLPGDPFAGVLALQDFDRFVYVLSVLEGYGDRNCAVLLGVSHREVRNTRTRALQHVADFEGRIAARDIHALYEQSDEAANQPSVPGGVNDHESNV